MNHKKIEINKTEQPSISNDITMANSNFCDFSSTLDLVQNTIILEKKEIAPELKEQIERMVDAQFNEVYKRINAEYDEKIEELIDEQEEISNKNEMIKSKYEALEEYLKNYCKRVNIDYENLLKEGNENYIL